MKDGADQAAPSGVESAVAGWLPVVLQFADEARGLSLAGFRQGGAVERKADGSPVTAVDRDVEALLRSRLARHWPSHGFVGEESGRRQGQGGFTWYVDPVDGTRSFVCGVPLWGTLIGLLQGDRPVLGVLDMPALDERWHAVQGGAAWYCEGRTAPRVCSTSSCTELAQARACLFEPEVADVSTSAAAQRLAQHCALSRRGGDCYAYGLLASGCVDLVVEVGLAPYDVLPLVPIVEAAGGVVRDWHGRPLGPDMGPCVIAAAREPLLEAAVAVLRD
ncbi:inositol monophosphatase family protein [Caldimonas brevitalea]|uniref:Histidinol-phosphatase n=1 Tax=Caldimonas brevitalea TaxID=413882 RepID=A0A0G3BIZ5_9BURK|nr:inositol monophosphatase family protein [Caldimonas brevitalea]AKJ29414.1 histidinol-phosphatase [Caldimonas brevitalea]